MEVRTGMTVEVQDAKVRAAVARVTTAAQSQGLRAVVGRAARNLVREHLFGLNAKRHRYGRGFYAQAARKTNFQPVSDGVRLGINQAGFRQRFYGGKITAKKADLLTIPEDPEAYGHRAREFQNLKVVRAMNPRTKRLQLALAKFTAHQEIVVRKRRSGAAYIKRGRVFNGDEVFYWLARSVNQKPDPGVLPPSFVIMQTATEAAAGYLGLTNSRPDLN